MQFTGAQLVGAHTLMKQLCLPLFIHIFTLWYSQNVPPLVCFNYVLTCSALFFCGFWWIPFNGLSKTVRQHTRIKLYQYKAHGWVTFSALSVGARLSSAAVEANGLSLKYLAPEMQAPPGPRPFGIRCWWEKAVELWYYGRIHLPIIFPKMQARNWVYHRIILGNSIGLRERM